MGNVFLSNKKRPHLHRSNVPVITFVQILRLDLVFVLLTLSKCTNSVSNLFNSLFVRIVDKMKLITSPWKFVWSDTVTYLEPCETSKMER